MLFQVAFVSPVSGLCLYKHKEFKKLYLASPGPASLLVSSEGWCWKQSRQSWVCSEIVTQVLLCWDYNADQSLWMVNVLSVISDRNRQKEATLISIAWIREGMNNFVLWDRNLVSKYTPQSTRSVCYGLSNPGNSQTETYWGHQRTPQVGEDLPWGSACCSYCFLYTASYFLLRRAMTLTVLVFTSTIL